MSSSSLREPTLRWLPIVFSRKVSTQERKEYSFSGKKSSQHPNSKKKKCSNFTASARHDRSCNSQGTRDKGGGGGKKHSPDKFSVLACWSRTEKDENMATRIWTNNCVSFLCAVSMTSTKHWNTGLGSRRQLWDKVFQKLTDDSTYTDVSNFHRINPSKEKLACSQVKM